MELQMYMRVGSDPQEPNFVIFSCDLGLFFEHEKESMGEIWLKQICNQQANEPPFLLYLLQRFLGCTTFLLPKLTFQLP